MSKPRWKDEHGSYENYLKSEEWLDIKRTVIEKYDGCCMTCRERWPIEEAIEVLQIHHTSYCDTMFCGHWNAERRLVPLCADCHRIIEFDFDQKRSLESANQELVFNLCILGIEAFRSSISN